MLTWRTKGLFSYLLYSRLKLKFQVQLSAFVLRSAVGKTHDLRSDLWWTIPLRIYTQKSTISTLAVKLSVSAIFTPRLTATLWVHFRQEIVKIALGLHTHMTPVCDALLFTRVRQNHFMMTSRGSSTILSKPILFDHFLWFIVQHCSLLVHLVPLKYATMFKSSV